MLEQQSYELPAAGNAQDRVLFHTAVIPAPRSSFIFLSLHLLHCIPALRMEQSFHFCFNGLTSRKRLPTGCLTYQRGRNTVKTQIQAMGELHRITHYKHSSDSQQIKRFSECSLFIGKILRPQKWHHFRNMRRLSSIAFVNGTKNRDWNETEIYLSCTLELLVWSTSLHLKVHNFKTLPLIKKVNIIRFGASKLLYFFKKYIFVFRK